MGTRSTWRGAACAAAALVVTLCLTAPAAAQSDTFKDARNDAGLRWRSNLQRETSTFVVPGRACLRPGDRHRVRVMLIASKTGKNHLEAGYTDSVSDGIAWTHWIRYR